MTNDVHARSRLIPKGERTRVRIIDEARHVAQGQEEPDDADRQADEEDPMPAERLGQDSPIGRRRGRLQI